MHSNANSSSRIGVQFSSVQPQLRSHLAVSVMRRSVVRSSACPSVCSVEHILVAIQQRTAPMRPAYVFARVFDKLVCKMFYLKKTNGIPVIPIPCIPLLNCEKVSRCAFSRRIMSITSLGLFSFETAVSKRD